MVISHIGSLLDEIIIQQLFPKITIHMTGMNGDWYLINEYAIEKQSLTTMQHIG